MINGFPAQVNQSNRVRAGRCTVSFAHISKNTGLVMYVCAVSWQTPVPDSVETFIRACTVSYGKAKLVLKHNKHYIESPFPEVLRELLKNPTVSQSMDIGGAVTNTYVPAF